MPMHRRELLAATALGLVLSMTSARARTISGGMPWRPFAGDPPEAVKPGPWVFFTPEEGAAVEALVDRLIPPDPETPGGKDCGCAVFIDRQLAGAYGSARGPLHEPAVPAGDAGAGSAVALTPAQLYRRMLAALDAVLSRYLRRQDVRAASRRAKRTGSSPGMENGSLQLAGTRAPRRSSRYCCRTRATASSPTRSTAATATWRRGR